MDTSQTMQTLQLLYNYYNYDNNYVITKAWTPGIWGHLEKKRFGLFT